MAKKALDRQGELKDATKTTLGNLARREGVDSMIAFLNRIKEVRTDLAVAVKPAEGVERFEAQYTQALAALHAFRIDTKGAPSWERIKAGITPEQLRLVERMDHPTLVLTPPVTIEQMVSAINEVGELGIGGFRYRFSIDLLYYGVEAEGELTWTVSIVEGGTAVRMHDALQRKGGQFRENHEQVAALLGYLKVKGLAALSGERNYLAAMMTALGQGQPIDKKKWTILNATAVETNPKSLLVFGTWDGGQINLNRAHPSRRDENICLRGAVRIKF